MKPLSAALAGLVQELRDDATRHARDGSLVPAAPMLERIANAIESRLQQATAETLTLSEAAQESGVPSETLRKQVAQGRIPNAGRKGAPRIRRGDLPHRGRATGGSYDPGADALQLMAGGARRRP